MYQIILASASPRRKEILTQIGLNPQIITSSKEERMEDLAPRELVKKLSEIKAYDVVQRVDGTAIILGADTIVVHKGQIFGKPKDKEDAIRMIMELQGDEHFVFTGVKIIIKEEGIETSWSIPSFAVETKVTVSKMTMEQATAYVNTNEPMDKAGAYAIQGKFAPYIEKIEGDYYNVVGFPISSIYHKLLEVGISLC